MLRYRHRAAVIAREALSGEGGGKEDERADAAAHKIIVYLNSGRKTPPCHRALKMVSILNHVVLGEAHFRK